MRKWLILAIFILSSTFAMGGEAPNLQGYAIPEDAIEKDGPKETVGNTSGLESKEYWLADVLVGRKAYYPNGKMASYISFESGKRHGVHRMWYEDGTKMYELYYKNGEPEVHGRFWHQNGQLKSETLFEDGLRHGSHKQWNSEGNLLGISKFNMGTGMGRQYYESGQIKIEMLFKKDKFHGIWRQWDENGKPLEATPLYWLNDSRVDKEKFEAQIESDELLKKYYLKE